MLQSSDVPSRSEKEEASERIAGWGVCRSGLLAVPRDDGSRLVDVSVAFGDARLI
jgi:hypothetical protein